MVTEGGFARPFTVLLVGATLFVGPAAPPTAAAATCMTSQKTRKSSIHVAPSVSGRR